MIIWLYTIVSVLVVSLISLVGVLALTFGGKKLEAWLVFLVSFAAGGLLGDVFFHLLPEVIEKAGFNSLSALVIIGGILIFFILEKFMAWRHCHIPTSQNHPHPVVFMNLVGDGVHNFIDGAVIAGSFLLSLPLGFATAMAIIFHEIPQEISDFGILLNGGFTKTKALFFNFLSSLAAIGGAVLVLAFGFRLGNLTNFLILFTIGGFIYIAGSDLIPELHKETKPVKSLLQLLGLCLGIGVMMGLKIAL